jgi:guanidinobutyrase
MRFSPAYAAFSLFAIACNKPEQPPAEPPVVVQTTVTYTDTTPPPSCTEHANIPAAIPSGLAAKLTCLPQDKVDFLVSDKTGGFAARPEILFARLDDKSPAEIEAYIDGMRAVLEQSKFHEGADQAAIPLNTDSPDFNRFSVKRPAAFDTPREPGPINVNRYMSAGPKQGIPTFFNLPVALTPEDLKAGHVEAAIVGAGLDMGSGYRGAAYAPRAVRVGEVYKSQGFVTPEHMHVMVSPFNELTVVDYGDIAMDQMSTERSIEHVRQIVREIAETGAIPMVVGGDHSLMYPDVAAITDVYGKGKVGVVHIDAHFDAGRDEPHFMSHGQPVFRLFKEGLVPGKNFIQVGLRGYWPGKSDFEWMRENGLRYHPMAEVEKKGWDKVVDTALSEARQGPEYIYVSFDVDSLDPAFMPGTGTPEPGGLTMREAMAIMRRVCAETKVVGFELVEVNPLVDPGYTTALNASRLLRECLTGIAMHKRGLTQPHYLSPLTTGHQ